MAFSPDNDITFIAETNFRGGRKRFGIKRQDRRKHVYIIGKTGMGKSTLLENMTIQDIQRGHGVAVVDPHGEYAERLLDFIPQNRINDVIYFNPADTDFPIAFNIMESVGEGQRHLVSSGLLGVFKKIFGPDVWSARMEYLLANAILGLLEIPGSTLLSVNRMFGEKDFRKRIVSQLTDPVIKGFWENEFAKYPEQYMREAVAAIQNKIGQFSGNPLIRNVIGQTETTLDMRKIMDEQKILIINLAKGRIGEENSRLLGAMMVTKLYLTAMSRVDLPEEDRKDFYLYVDEFQNFATESFANILSEARKYRLNLTVAHQYIFQMEEEVQHAVFGNVGTMILFRTGAEDAELLEKEFMPEFIIQDLVNLSFKQIYTKLMIDGVTSRPFSAETLPPFPRPLDSYRDAIIQSSRETYSTPRASVEEAIRRFTQPFGGELHSAIQAVRSETPGERSAVLPQLNPVRSIRPVEVQESEGPPASKADRPMYEAICAVDGKKIMVPFKPDGKRPVYCEEHMGMIKFRAKASDVVAEPQRSEQRTVNSEQRGESREPFDSAQGKQRVENRGENRAQNTMPLSQLRNTNPRENSRPRVEPNVQKQKNLSELRKALEESLRRGGENRGERVENRGREVTPAAQGANGVLTPGETIRFE